MTEFVIPSGIVREMEEGDVLKLAYISQDRRIYDYFFVKEDEEAESLFDYWNKIFRTQEKARIENGGIRTNYGLTIKENGIVKGGLFVLVDPYAIAIRDRSNRTGIVREKYHPMHSVSLGYFIGKEHRRQGLCTRVLQAAVPFVFEDIGEVGRVSATTLECNVASQKALKKAGFKRRGIGISYGKVRGKRVVLYALDYLEYLKERHLIYVLQEHRKTG